MIMRSTGLIFVALGCGFVASLGVYQYLKAASKQDETRTVLVAAKEININEPLNQENVRIMQWDGRLIPQGSLSELKQVENKYARIRLYPGEPILGAKVMNWDDASGSLKVPKGYRAVSVKVTMEASVSSLIEPGDHVDVIVVVKRSQDTPSMAKTILRAVQVFAVNSQMAKSQDKDKTLDEVRTVSLLVDPDQAEKLSMGQDLGTIRLALRSPGDEMVDETIGCTLDRLLGRGDVADPDAGHAALSGQTEAVAADAESTSPSAEQDGWTMIVDSPVQTKEFRLAAPGQTPRLTGGKDKKAAPDSLAAPPASPEPPEAPIPAQSATAAETSGSGQPIPRQEATASFRL